MTTSPPPENSPTLRETLSTWFAREFPSATARQVRKAVDDVLIPLGQQVQVQSGAQALEAARRAGRQIRHILHTPDGGHSR